MLRAAVMPVTFGFKTHAIHGAIYFRNARNRLDLLGKRGFLFQVDYFAAKTCPCPPPLKNPPPQNPPPPPKKKKSPTKTHPPGPPPPPIHNASGPPPRRNGA